jgi:hypothetical protein
MKDTQETQELTYEESKTLRYICEHDTYQYVPTSPKDCGVLLSIAKNYEFGDGAIKALEEKGLFIIENRRVRLTKPFNQIKQEHPEIMQVKLSGIAWSMHNADPTDPRYQNYDQYNDEDIDWD